MRAAGKAIIRLALNLSFNLTPWVRVAAIVVSDIKDKLSPNIAPPMTIPTASGVGIPILLAKPIPIGTMAVIVPIEVPIEKDIKQEIINSPGNKKAVGTKRNAQFTVASRAPISIVRE